MFEKEAEEYQIRKHHQRLYGHKPVVMKELNTTYKDGFKDGYNKANEWHFVKDGLPKMSTEFIYCSDDLIFLTKDCSGNILKHFGYFNSRKRFEEYNTGYEFISDKVIAWKEIVLPELKESE